MGEAVRVIKEGVEGWEKGMFDGVESMDEGGRDGVGKEALALGEKGKKYDWTQKIGEDAWIQEAVRLLDMAVIMAGAPEREEMFESLLSELQCYVEDHTRNGPPKKKRRRDEGVFASEGINVPEIRFPIFMRSALSLEAFEKHLKTCQPLVIRDALTHWPALCERPWNKPSYSLEKTFGGRRLVPVEIGRSYTDDGWGQSIVTFGEFMDRYLLHDTSYGHERSGEVVDGHHIAYLAQHDLLSQIPSLRADISIPDYCYTNPPPPAPNTPLAAKLPRPKLEEPLLNAWFGPAGTISPLHTDPYHNILCQVVGKKYVRLYSPEESVRLYPRGVDAASGVDMGNTSEVDVEGPHGKGERFPLFADARFLECVLEEGECLYVPVGWWHYIRSLSVSFSVSFWWN